MERVFRVNSRFAINEHWAFGELHHWTLQLHHNGFDGGMAVSLISSDLDVEVIVAALAQRRQNIVAGWVQLENVPIKGLEVEVAPCTANLAVVDGTHTCRTRSAAAATLYTSLYSHGSYKDSLQLLPTSSPVIFSGNWDMENVFTADFASVERSESYLSSDQSNIQTQ